MMINPILRNEMKTDGRRFRFYLLLMLYIALMGMPMLLLYNSTCSHHRISPDRFLAMYMFLACIQAIILMFLVPALTANTITGEREKQTLDILLTTKMSPRQIIWGKLLGAVSKVMLLIMCTLPVYMIVIFLGGINIKHILSINAYLMATTICVSAMSIWVSTMVKTSKFASVASYFLELGWIIGPPIIMLAISIFYDGFYDDKNKQMVEKLMHIICVSPGVGYGHLLGKQLMQSLDWIRVVNIVDAKMMIPGYCISLIVEAVLTVVFMEWAIRRLNPRRKKWFHGRSIKRSNKTSKHQNTYDNNEVV